MKCTTPVMVKGSIYPCGHCVQCRILKAHEWSYRLSCELNYHKYVSFVTLTYDELHVPAYSLRKKHLQLFHKRLRKLLPHMIKYFCCGEYGPRTKRPHYHGIYFGVSVADRPIIEKAWNLGFITISRVTPKRIDYVTGYVLKKFSSKENKKIYEKKHLEMPFQICSQGLGLSYVCDHADELRLNLGDRFKGRNINLPRYYCHKLDIDSDILAAISDYRQRLLIEEHNFKNKTEIDLFTIHSAQRHVYIDPDSGLAQFYYNFKYEAPFTGELEIASNIVYQENSIRKLRDRNKVL